MTSPAGSGPADPDGEAARRGAAPILIAYDGSENARHAIEVAGTLLSGHAIVMHVWTLPHPFAAAAGVGLAPIADQETEELEQRALRHAQRLAEEGVTLARQAGFACEPEVVAGSGGVTGVWHAIAAVADDRDVALIVVGHRGLSRVRSALLGSVSHGLVHHTRRPVLVIPPVPS